MDSYSDISYSGGRRQLEARSSNNVEPQVFFVPIPPPHLNRSQKRDGNNDFPEQRLWNLSAFDEVEREPLENTNDHMFSRTENFLERLSINSGIAKPQTLLSNSTLAGDGSSTSSYQSTSTQKTQVECDTKKLSFKEKKKLIKEMEALDDKNHRLVEEYSCGLCSIIVPDRETMIRHSESQMHLKNFLKYWMESLEKDKGNVQDDGSVSSSSDDSDGFLPPVKMRVKWNL